MPAIMRLPEVLTMLGISATTIWRWERQGRFPRRLKLGPHLTGWVKSEVEEWFQQQTAARLNRNQVSTGMEEFKP